jgi:hypothetical protein
MDGRGGRIEGGTLTGGAEHALHHGRGVRFCSRSESSGRERRRMHAGDRMMHRRCLRDHVVLGHGEG